MSRLLRALAVVVALTVLLGLAAPAGATSAAKSKPAPWAKSVCTKIGAWHKAIEKASDKATSGSPSSAKAAKKTLLKLLGSTITATKKLLKDLRKVGAPTGPGGKQASSIVQQGYVQALSTITEARSELKSASTSDVGEFQGAARTAEDSLEAGLEHVQQAMRAATTIDSPALVGAMNAQSACTDLTA